VGPYNQEDKNMNESSFDVGNEQAQSQPTDQGNNEQRVNPGAIRKSTTQSILKAASAASGMEFDSVEAMAAALARLSAMSATQQTTVTPQQSTQETVQNKRTTTTDLEQQFKGLKAELAQKEQALRERELDGQIRGAMGDKFDTDLVDYALSKVKSGIKWEDGQALIVNSKGEIRYDDNGNPMSIEGLVNEVAQNNPKLLKVAQTQSNGSGLRPRAGQFGGESEVMPDYATDPAGFNAWAVRSGLGKGVGLRGVGVSVSNSLKR
jgi:hypothetical protein